MADNATICFRERISIHADAAAGGSGQPDYSSKVIERAPAEVRAVSAGETVRGRQVEAGIDFVVTMRYISQAITPRCRVTVLSGPYTGRLIYVHGVIVEDKPGRPRRLQLHCGRTGQR